MIILIDTSTPICRTTLVDGDRQLTHEWEAGRTLARDLLGHLEKLLAAQNRTFHDVSGIGIMQGPGSFTGLRISMAVGNTLADSLNIPIVGAQGDDWRERALERLSAGDNDQLVLPFYGSEATITKPRK